jgi:hypothetical protein
MGLTCAKLRTDAPVPTDVDFGEWADVEKALLDRQKAQQSEPRPEVAPPPADAAKAFREAAHEQLAGEATEKITARLEYGDGSTVPITIDVTPVCPRCLGVEPGKPAGDPDHPHPGPFTAEVCEACFLAAREPGERLSDSAPIAVTPLSVGRLPESFIADLVAAEGEKPLKDPDEVEEVERLEWLAENGSSSEQVNARAELMKRGFGNPPGSPPAPRKRRSSRGAQTVTVDLDPDGSLTAMKDGVVKAAIAVGSPEPKVFVLLTEAEFIALAPLPALAAAGLLTPPEDFAERFEWLLSALRTGAFRPSDGVFIGSVPEACKDALAHLSDIAMNYGVSGVQWSTFVEQLRAHSRLTDLAKYGGKLVRA